MNAIVAGLLTDLTAPARFAGDLNVDLNEICTNMVPFPRMHYLVAGISPLPDEGGADGGGGGCDAGGGTRGGGGGGGGGRRGSLPPLPREAPGAARRRMAHLFGDALSRRRQLLSADPRHARYLACGLLLRGDVEASDAHAAVERLRAELDMVPWNREGFKIGVCGVPPLGRPRSLLCLANNCCVAGRFDGMAERFARLYRRRAMLHHYTQFVEPAVFDEAYESLLRVAADYAALGGASDAGGGGFGGSGIGDGGFGGSGGGSFDMAAAPTRRRPAF
ncbi:unnamed protein product [Phaeothamnion confervicola]